MLRAIIVDDENKSIKNLQLLIEGHCPEITIAGTANNALQAVKIIVEQKPDILFLDVQMPGYNGFDVLDQITGTSARVIFTTAHKDYAIEALRKGAFDYLLKPIDPEELVKCVRRINTVADIPDQRYPSTIELHVKDGIIFIRPEEIIRLEASGSYTEIHLDNRIKHIASKSMKEFEKKLNPNSFYRCHNSHVINLTKVKKFVSSNGFFAEMNDGSLAEVSKKNKEEFLQKFKS